MKYIIREIKREEFYLLNDFLYEAIYVPKGAAAPPKEIIAKPELQVYVRDFGNKTGDFGLAAEVEHKIVGAVWVRIMNDYGHIDDETPSLAISLYKNYRNHGIGTDLMKAMLCLLKKKGYQKASLSVQRENYAIKAYKNVGFEIVNENDEEYIMMIEL